MALMDFLLSTDNVKMADCFDITLPNGFVIQATTWQQDLIVGGNTYYATKYGKWERGGTTEDIKGTETTELELVLPCDPTILFPYSASTPMFQRAKLFARSAVKVTVVYMDFNQVIQGSHVQFVGVVTVPAIEAAKVTFRCVDYSFQLQAPWPKRVICSGCPFTVFDSNCALDKSSYAVSKTALSGTSGRVIQVSSMSAIGNDSLPYTKGYIVPTSGEAQGFHIAIETQVDSTHIQLEPFAIPISIGDTFTMYPGCTGTTDACQNKFSNLINFGGFPYVPKPEGALTGG